MTFLEGDKGRLALILANTVDAGNYFHWNGKCSLFASGNEFPCGKVVEVVASLQITSGAKANRANGSRLLGVGGLVLFVNLSIRSEGELIMLCVVKLDAYDKTSRADS